MTKVHSLLRWFTLILVLTLSAGQYAHAQDGDPALGKTVWNANACGSCHNANMAAKMTGPALGGVEERWADYPREDLYAWIRNSQALIATGHPRANELWDEWQSVMSSYTALTDEEIEGLLAFIDGMYNGTYPPRKEGDPGPDEGVTEEADNTWLFITLAVLLGLLSVVLARVTSNLAYMKKAKEGNAPAQRRTLGQVLTSRGVVAFVVFTLVVLGGYATVNQAVDMGRQQNYQPTQPIAFSHVTHAGLNQIECQYCHDGARRSKHSVIPAANTCMNCHAAIKYGSNYGTAELTKIYASVGWNPNDGKYIDGYEDMTMDEVRQIYESWIANQYQENGGNMDRMDRVVDQQWEDIVASIGKGNEMPGPEQQNNLYGPIEWVRIHNLPDHVYFNHKQHVVVGNLECQNCHGPVEQMEKVWQYSPLSMGWCINCHRQTEVSAFENNEYYQAYEQYHEQLQNGTRDKVTVEDIGGLACQRCHY
ncbi:MAG: c-type cytochrome [Bacteroidota bacterium]